MKLKTLTQAFEDNSHQRRFIGFIEGQEKEKIITFEDLHNRALGLLYYLQKKGMRKGDYLILYLNSNEQLVDIFWACQFGGIIPVPLAVGINDQHRQKVFNVTKRLENAFLYTQRKDFKKLETSAQENANKEIFNELAKRTLLSDKVSDLSNQGEQSEIKPDDISFIQFSSGSTGDPKGIILKHRNLISNIKSIFEGGKSKSDEVSLSWMPLTHDMGLIGFHLTPIVFGMNHYLMRTELFVRRPLIWMTEASEKKANILCSPNFGYKHFLRSFKRTGLNNIDLSSVRLIFNGAEPVSINLCNQFTDTLAPFGLIKQSIFPVYGLAEASLAVTFPKVGEKLITITVSRNSLQIGNSIEITSSEEDGVELVSVGKTLNCCQLRIGDDKGNELPTNTVGHIQITGESVTEKIIGDSNSIFSKDGWLDTGDIGFISNQELFITGRFKEIIFINGQNYYPHDIENILHTIGDFELGKVAVAGVSSMHSRLEEVLAFVFYKENLVEFSVVTAKIKTLVNEQFGFEIHHVIPINKMPKTTSGKIQRSVLAERYLSGEFKELIGQLSLTEKNDQVAEKIDHSDKYINSISQICKEALPGKSFTVHDSLLEIGASSLALVEIHTGLDEIYPGQIEITDLVDHPTIFGLAQFLKDKESLIV